jgi:hypothetical protein
MTPARDAESPQVESLRRCERIHVHWSGTGDHVIWAFGKQKLHANHHGDELDPASVKAASKLLNAPLSETVEAIRLGRTIRPRSYVRT